MVPLEERSQWLLFCHQSVIPSPGQILKDDATIFLFLISEYALDRPPLTNHITLIFGARPLFFALWPRFINNSKKGEEIKGNAFPYSIGSTHHIKKTQATSILYHGHATLPPYSNSAQCH
jgi:hypothetical protein